MEMFLRILSVRACCSGRHDENDGNDESVKGKSLSEDHHQDKGNKDILLTIGAYTSITNNADSEASSEGGKSTAEA